MAKAQRPDIQGLRTIAVGIVIVYHLWPNFAPGGFVGVDVFFIISGFLIVGSLVREAVSTGKIGLLAFYARRIRRLLPAATLVLLAVVVGTFVFLPQSRWQSVSWDVAMSTLQVQNWNQGFSSASYEGATAAVSPVQHYWSLAVEEQFYIVIPILILLAVTLARHFNVLKSRACLTLVLIISAPSFAHSVFFSGSNHNLAYFATTTRMWELGLGGILALLVHRIKLTALSRFLMGWSGLILIFVSVFLLSTTLPFPGSIALIPVLGTCAILMAGSGIKSSQHYRAGSISSFLSLRPMTFVGDISYSLYLWHWPVIVFWVSILGREPGVFQGAMIVVLSLSLAWLSYRFVEQRCRHGKPVELRGGRRFRQLISQRAAYGFAILQVGSSVAAAGVPWTIVQMKASELGVAADNERYPGAEVFDPVAPARVPSGVTISPDHAVALKDVPLTGKDECGIFDPEVISESQCIYGPADATKTAAVVGDSHASQYVDPILAAGAANGWKVSAMVRNGCPFSAIPPIAASNALTNCSDQNKVTLQRLLKSKPQLVVISAMTPAGYAKALQWTWHDEESLVEGYIQLLKPLRDAGIPVSVILDNPYPDSSASECVLKNGALSTICSARPSSETGAMSDPLKRAAEQVSGVRIVNLQPYFCRNSFCPDVIGNVLIYRDNHMTNTFAKTFGQAIGSSFGALRMVGSQPSGLDRSSRILKGEVRWCLRGRFCTHKFILGGEL
ncbi:acyltransferase family protein [Renibacterium salmoninarum]|uniref:acyltransferase family protein n=1 Tax=Renibacterium salmoninarum TaxID=1646 RepID=UPI0013149A1E|nr:acyltransferase family protein [Renibacterium salmoninarum]